MSKSLFTPEQIQTLRNEFGSKGSQWINILPKRIERLEQVWDFRCGPTLEHGGTVSWVAIAELKDGSEAIVKIGYPHIESRYEADALKAFDGNGAIRLLKVSDDGCSMLLERCRPRADLHLSKEDADAGEVLPELWRNPKSATDLWQLSEAEADAVACQILQKLWKQPEPGAPFETLASAVDQWWLDLEKMEDAGKYDASLVQDAKAKAQELLATQPEAVLLHGDFHPANVLAAEREPWLAIDPKPLIGDRAYDLAQWLHNRYRAAAQTADPVTVLRSQVECFATRLPLDRNRIAAWAFVKALGWKWEPEVVEVFQSVSNPW